MYKRTHGIDADFHSVGFPEGESLMPEEDVERILKDPDGVARELADRLKGDQKRH